MSQPIRFIISSTALVIILIAVSASNINTKDTISKSAIPTSARVVTNSSLLSNTPQTNTEDNVALDTEPLEQDNSNFVREIPLSIHNYTLNVTNNIVLPNKEVVTYSLTKEYTPISGWSSFTGLTDQESQISIHTNKRISLITIGNTSYYQRGNKLVQLPELPPIVCNDNQKLMQAYRSDTAYDPLSSTAVYQPSTSSVPLAQQNDSGIEILDVVFGYTQVSLSVDVDFILNFLDEPSNKTTQVEYMIANTLQGVLYANQTMENSGLNIYFNVLGFWEIKEDIPASTDSLVTIISDMAARRDTPEGNFVRKADIVGADLKVILTSSENDLIGGRAYLNSDVSAARTIPSRTYVLIHEWGHNFGCMHDREADGTPNAPGIQYGHNYLVNGQPRKTVMSVTPGYVTQSFSSPNLFDEGIALGTETSNNKAHIESVIVEFNTRYNVVAHQPSYTGEFINLSTRGHIGNGANSMIGGFVLQGDSSQEVLIRGIGSGLTPYNVPNVAPDPQLQVMLGSTEIGFNDNWDSSVLESTTSLGGFTLPEDSLDSAIYTSLTPTAHTAIISSETPGTGLVEVYNSKTTPTKLVNVSTRAQVKVDTPLIAGFILNAPDGGTKRFVIRALGETLKQYGLNTVGQNLTLEVFNSSGVSIATNTVWSDNPRGQLTEAYNKNPEFREPALIMDLPSGAYTAVVTVDQTSYEGIILVEVEALSDITDV